MPPPGTSQAAPVSAIAAEFAKPVSTSGLRGSILGDEILRLAEMIEIDPPA